MKHLQYAMRKCGCHTINMRACGACNKCLDHCKCSKGNLELFEALARNKLERARQQMIKDMTNVPQEDILREGGHPMPNAGELERTGPKKKFRMG